jgi:acetate kinase
MPEVLRLASAGEARARLALELYCYRVRKFIGAYAAVLGGIDAVVFGGGVGQNAADVRSKITEPLAWLGLELDPARNTSRPVDQAITTEASKVVAWVVRLDEAEEMARISKALLTLA